MLPGPQLPGADRQPAGQLGLGGRGEGAGLLVAHVHPVDAASRAGGRVDDRVQAVADDAVDPLDAGLTQYLDELLGDGGVAHLVGALRPSICAPT